MTVAFGSQKMKLSGLIAQERQTNNFLCVCFCLFIYLFMLVLAKTYSRFNTDSEYIYTFNRKM